jgi:hypothetical protein
LYNASDMLPPPLLSSQVKSVKGPVQLAALYTAAPPSVSDPAMVSSAMLPIAGATKLYHTSALLNAAQPGAGGPVVVVAFTLVPPMALHDVPTVSEAALQGLSLATACAQMVKVPVAPPLPQTRA